MEKKQVVLLGWAVILVILLVYIGMDTTKDKVYTGTDIEFYTGSNIQIDAQKVTFQAVSNQFFALYNENGETIAGGLSIKPLGWKEKQYFVYGPQEVSGGNWLFQAGFASVKITSDEATTVVVSMRDPFLLWFVYSLIALILWLVGYLIVD